MGELKKKYGLLTAMGMVIGIVIGSGVFFKAQNVLNSTKGDMPLGIIAWLIGGVVMIVCGYVFANFATKYEKVNGLVDYAEATVGKKYAYYLVHGYGLHSRHDERTCMGFGTLHSRNIRSERRA